VTKDVKQGKILKDDKDGVEIELGDGKGRGGIVPIASALIADIDFDVNAEGFRDAVTAFKRGSYTSAAEGLQGLLESKETLDTVRAVARPYVYFLLAESKFRGGKTAEAITAYQKLITTFPDSRYVAFAVTNMADLAIQTKAFEKLPPLLATLRAGSNDSKQLADYYEGESLMAQGKPADALKKYTAAAGGTAARVKAMALVGQARCYIAANEAGKARDAAQNALNLSPGDSVAAAAHSLIGDAILADADNRKVGGMQLSEALMDAVLEYLRVQNQYPADARAEGYAVLKAGECFKRLAKLPGRTAGDDQSRAVMMFSRLASERRFANTEFPNKAFKFLDEMK